MTQPQGKSENELRVDHITRLYVKMASVVICGQETELRVNTQFMQAVEKAAEATAMADDFRRSIAAYAGMCEMKGIDYAHNLKLRKTVCEVLSHDTIDCGPGGCSHPVFSPLWTDNGKVVYVNVKSLIDDYLRQAAAYILWPRLKPEQRVGQEPDETFMRAVEDCCDIPEQYADDHRRNVTSIIGALLARGEEYTLDVLPEGFVNGCRKYVAQLTQGQTVPPPDDADPCETVYVQ